MQVFKTEIWFGQGDHSIGLTFFADILDKEQTTDCRPVDRHKTRDKGIGNVECRHEFIYNVQHGLFSLILTTHDDAATWEMRRSLAFWENRMVMWAWLGIHSVLTCLKDKLLPASASSGEKRKMPDFRKMIHAVPHWVVQMNHMVQNVIKLSSAT